MSEITQSDIASAQVLRLAQTVPKFDQTQWKYANLTDEQFVIAGSRYNRGTARPLKDFQASLNSAPGSANREYTSYGRAMLRHRDEVKKLLGI